MLVLPRKDGKVYTHNGSIIKTSVTIDPTMSNNDWGIIMFALKERVAPSSWLGQSKQIGSGSYAQYSLQLIDMASNRYEKVNGGYTNAVLQFVTMPPAITWNNGANLPSNLAYSNNYIKTAVNSIKEGLPNHIAKNIARVDLPLAGECEVFLPCVYELIGSTSINNNLTVSSEESSSVFQYYANNFLNLYQKTDQEYGYVRNQWTRTLASNDYPCIVDTGTSSTNTKKISANSITKTTTNWYAPIFAI